MGNVIKDIGEIWTRLFDHRPFLAGEIKFFLREFEEKRSDREVENLFKILQTGAELKDTDLEKVKTLADTQLLHLAAVIESATARSEDILSREPVFRQDKTVENSRDLRRVEWESFSDDISEKRAKVDEAFTEKEANLKEFYLDLERKLHISPAHSKS